MTNNLQFDAVIFDMDGLMFDTEQLAYNAWRHTTHSHGHSFTDEFYQTLIGKNVADTDRAIQEAFGVDFPVAAMREERRRYIIAAINREGLAIKSGLLELLQFLNENKIPMAVASSTRRAIVEENLRRAGIGDYFQILVCGDEVTHGKPHPEMHLKTADLLSKHPSTCIVLEDSLPGIEAAHAAGTIPIMIPDMQQPTEAVRRIAHAIFDSLHDVRTYLAGNWSESPQK